MLFLLISLLFMAAFLTASLAVGATSILVGRRWFQAPVAALGGSLPEEAPLLLRQQPLSTISVWRQLLARFDFVKILELRLTEAGLKWSIGRTTLMIMLLGSAVAAMLFAADVAPLLTAPIAFTVVALLPYFYILRKRKQRFRQLEFQFSDALDSLSRALRAGQTFGAGMELVANECSEPLAQELRRTCSEWKLGLAWDQALENFALRVPLLEIRLFVAAVILQTRFGGKLNEILEELAKTIRDSLALQGELRAVSAQGRLTGAVLTLLPLIIAAIMFLTNPSYVGMLLYHPYSKYLITGALASLVLGHFTIQRIVDIKA
jgi:tight adherence protein B